MCTDRPGSEAHCSLTRYLAKEEWPSYQDLFIVTWLLQRTGIQTIENRWEQELKHFQRADKFVKTYFEKNLKIFLTKQIPSMEQTLEEDINDFKDKILRQYK